MDCRICGKAAMHSDVCEEHYCCDGCGTKTGLVFRLRGIWCDPCHDQRAAQQVAAFDDDTNYTREITCPWCGDEKGDSWEAEDSGEEACDNCGHEYEWEREYDITYRTTKAEQQEAAQ